MVAVLQVYERRTSLSELLRWEILWRGKFREARISPSPSLPYGWSSSYHLFVEYMELRPLAVRCRLL